MSKSEDGLKRVARKCLKGAEAFLKSQIAILRVNAGSSEISIAVEKLKKCIDVIRQSDELESKQSKRRHSSSTAMDMFPEWREEPASFPKADKIGRYVQNYFRWLERSNVEIPQEFKRNGLDLRWSVSNLKLWKPLFAKEYKFTTDGHGGRRYWSRPFTFCGERFYVNSQWYKNQKTAFDKFAISLAASCGLCYEPYELPGVPEDEDIKKSLRAKDNKARISVAGQRREVHFAGEDAAAVTIQISSSKRFKG